MEFRVSEIMNVLFKINQHRWIDRFTFYEIADLVVISLCKLLKNFACKKTKIKKTKK